MKLDSIVYALIAVGVITAVVADVVGAAGLTIAERGLVVVLVWAVLASYIWLREKRKHSSQ